MPGNEWTPDDILELPPDDDERELVERAGDPAEWDTDRPLDRRERRERYRKQVGTRLDREALIIPPGDARMLGHVVDVSVGGAFIATKRPLPVDTDITVRVRIGGRPMDLKATVRWVRAAAVGDDAAAGMGVAWRDHDIAVRNALVSFLDDGE